MITDPAFYAVGALAILLTGISKGGFAGAFGGIAVPLLSIYIAPQQAAGIMLPVLLAMDAFGLAAFFKNVDWKVFKTLILGGIAGTALGTVTFGALDPNVVRIVIGVVAVGFPLMAWLKVGALDPARPPAQPSHLKGTIAATASSYTSFIAHIGAPPALIYLMPLRLEKQHLVATNAVYFAFINVIKIPSYAGLGQLSATNLSTALVLCLMAPVGIRFGIWLQGKVTTETVYRVGRIGLFCTGCKLIYDGLSAHFA